MTELGGFEFAGVSENQGNASEALSEEALSRLQANSSAIAAIRREEKKSKQKDSAVANVLLQFLQDERYSHLFVLISRLVARNCPSIFILSIIALIHKAAADEVQEYLKTNYNEQELQQIQAVTSKTFELATGSPHMFSWLTTMQMVLATNSTTIIRSLLLDAKNIDGAVLQLTCFVIQEYYKTQQKNVPYEKVQPIAMQLLHSVLAPYIATVQKNLLDEESARASRESV